MMCDRCEDAILPGEPYEEIPIDRPTGAAFIVILHKKPCERPLPLRQTAPVDRWNGRLI